MHARAAPYPKHTSKGDAWDSIRQRLVIAWHAARYLTCCASWMDLAHGDHSKLRHDAKRLSINGKERIRACTRGIWKRSNGRHDSRSGRSGCWNATPPYQWPSMLQRVGRMQIASDTAMEPRCLRVSCSGPHAEQSSQTSSPSCMQ